MMYREYRNKPSRSSNGGVFLGEPNNDL